jgi:hypothetical protein
VLHGAIPVFPGLIRITLQPVDGDHVNSLSSPPCPFASSSRPISLRAEKAEMLEHVKATPRPILFGVAADDGSDDRRAAGGFYVSSLVNKDEGHMFHILFLTYAC